MTPWQEWKAKNAERQASGVVRPWDLLNSENLNFDETVSAKRYEICEACPRFLKITKQCKECGCFMHLKVKLKEAVCPLEKW